MKNNEKATPSEEGQLTKKEPESTDIDKEIDELAKEAPPEVRKLLKEASPEARRTFMGFMMRTTMGGALPHPLFDKFTPQHVDKFLDLNEEDSKRNFKFACQGRRFTFGAGIIILNIYNIPHCLFASQ